MRPLTFRGFLKRYVQELAGEKTLSLRRLVKIAAINEPRLREPLYLYAAETDQIDRLLLLGKNSKLEPIYKPIKSLESTRGLIQLVQNNDARVPERFRRVWRSYQSLCNRHQSEQHTKTLMHKRIRHLQTEKHITSYQLHRDLGLNAGNLNAFLKHGDVSKLSLQTARRILHYLEKSELHC
jgi:hypothetical protein